MSSWSDDTKELVDFAKAMERAGAAENTTDVIERPYKFKEAHEIWVEYDYPSEEDANWDEFVKEISGDEE